MTQDSGFVAISPAWADAAGLLIAALENGDEEARRVARSELRRLAALADKLIHSAKALSRVRDEAKHAIPPNLVGVINDALDGLSL